VAKDIAVLRIYSDIGEPSFDFFMGSSEAFSSKDLVSFLDEHKEEKQIEVHINSCGGDVQEGWAIYDLLKGSGKKIKTIGEGKVYSIATVIFLAGDEREMMPNADGLIHLPHIPEYTLSGQYQADDLKAIAEQLEQEEQKILNLYVSVTGQPEQVLRDYMDNETKMSSDDMIKLGFATKIAEPVKAVAYYNFKKQKMAEFDEKGFWNKFEEKLTNFSRLFGVKNQQELTDTSGAKFTLEKESGDPAVGDKAAPDGVYTMPKGEVITVKGGLITEIAPAAPQNEEAKALKAENEALKKELEGLKTQAKAATEAEASFKAKETEAKALVTELQNMKNEWKPDGRTGNPGKNSTENGNIKYDVVKENLKKLREAR
jgi:ATP-dependent Clp protease, protease subunit